MTKLYQKKQPKYKEGNPCKKCGTTRKIFIKRKNPITGITYKTIRCHHCSKIYNRVIEHRGGLAVVPLQGSACGGCGAHIPPQTASEVRAKTAVHTCGVCGRFLYNN